MPVLTDADAIHLGGTTVDKVYAGSTMVWPPAGAWGPDESLYPVAVNVATPADPNVFPLGNRIRILVGGRIPAFRYYVVSAPIATRQLTLWTEAGVLITKTTNVVEVTGWNVVPITPVPVVAGQVIVTAWGYPGSAVGGSFSYNSDGIAVASTHLQWVSGMYGNVGTPADSFPANTIAPNHYFADIVFQEGPGS